MKWTHKDERCVKRFAFLPYENEEEVRWLETVRIVQKGDYIHRIWVNDRFVGDEE